MQEEDESARDRGLLEISSLIPCLYVASLYLSARRDIAQREERRKRRETETRSSAL